MCIVCIFYCFRREREMVTFRAFSITNFSCETSRKYEKKKTQTAVRQTTSKRLYLNVVIMWTDTTSIPRQLVQIDRERMLKHYVKGSNTTSLSNSLILHIGTKYK